MLLVSPRSDSAAEQMVEQLHAGPVGRLSEHMCQWVTQTFQYAMLKLALELAHSDLLIHSPCPGRDSSESKDLVPRGLSDVWSPSPWCTEEGLGFARTLLAWDPLARPTPNEALQHPFFNHDCL
jgi:hypothetical protein